MNPVTVRLMGRRGLWLVCPTCHGKRGDIRKIEAAWKFVPCAKCGGRGEIPNDNPPALNLGKE